MYAHALFCTTCRLRSFGTLNRWGLALLVAIATVLPGSRVAANTAPENLGHLSTHVRTVREVLEATDPADAFWFFTSGSHTKLQVDVYGGPNTWLQLYERRARRWSSHQTVGTNHIRIARTVNAGWHYIRIGSGSSTTNVPYTLILGGADPGYFRDAGSGRTTATPVPFRYAAPDLHYAFVRDRVDTNDRSGDVFQLDLPFINNHVQVHTMESYGGGAFVELWDANGQTLASGLNIGLDGVATLERTLPVGRYYVRLAAAGVQRSSQRFTTSYGTGYGLYVTAKSTHVDHAGNNFLTELDLGVLGGPIKFRDMLARDRGDPIDAFRFQVVGSGRAVTISARNEFVRLLPQGGDVDVWLGDTSFQTVRHGNNGGDESFQVFLQPGTYHLLVTHTPLGRSVTPVQTPDMFYELRIDPAVVPQTDFGAATPALAFTQLPTQIISRAGSSAYTPYSEPIGGFDTADFFRVTVPGLPGAQMVGFHAEVTPTLPSGLTLELWQNRPGGLVQINANVRVAGGVVLLDAGVAPGQYIIGVVSTTGVGSVGSVYTLTLQTRW